MKHDIIWVPSAFKHDVTKEDIRHVLSRPEYEGLIEDEENKYIVIGFDLTGNLLEILYNEVDYETRKVFHAMPCRNSFFHLLDT